MCEPVSIVTGVMAAVSAITSTVISIDQENKAIEAQNKANIHNANIAIDEANDLSKQEGIAEQNEQKAAAEQTLQLKRANMQKAGTAKAKSEAEHVLRLVNGYNLSYPIYYDLEESSVRSKLSSSQIADIAETFCRIIEDAGYEVAIYANTDWFTNYLTDSRFDQWDKWVAQYNDICTYTGEYSMWQCSSKGIVDGLAGYTDLNIDLGAYVGGNSVDGRRIVKSGGKIYGYEGAYKLYGAQKILQYWYYFDKSKDGAAHIGWRTDGTKTYYYDENGRLAQGAKKIGSYWYYFAGNGTMYTGWRTDGTKTYYYDKNGRLAQKAAFIDGRWYNFKSNGELIG